MQFERVAEKWKEDQWHLRLGELQEVLFAKVWHSMGSCEEDTGVHATGNCHCFWGGSGERGYQKCRENQSEPLAFCEGRKRTSSSKYSDPSLILSLPPSSLLLGSPLESQPDSRGQGSTWKQVKQSSSTGKRPGRLRRWNWRSNQVSWWLAFPASGYSLGPLPEPHDMGCHYWSISGLHCEVNFPKTSKRWRGKAPYTVLDDLLCMLAPW